MNDEHRIVIIILDLFLVCFCLFVLSSFRERKGKGEVRGERFILLGPLGRWGSMDWLVGGLERSLSTDHTPRGHHGRHGLSWG